MKTCAKTSMVPTLMLLACGWMLAGRLQAQTFRNLHSFTTLITDPDLNTTTNSDGAGPRAGLILAGGKLYGTTSSGGSQGSGTVFAVNTDGTSFTTLYDFTAKAPGPCPCANSDGWGPAGQLVLSSNMLFGTTGGGGSGGSGTVFTVNTDGTGFTTLYTFTPITITDPSTGVGINSDGAGPGDVTLADNTLYGTTGNGGAGGNGTIFAINTDGTGFTNLYTFSSGSGTPIRPINSDGAGPLGLILSSNTLYGAASGGGSGGNGTVFAINSDGTGFRVLHTFTPSAFNYGATNSDGVEPLSGLVLSGSSLYGTTYGGGASGNGTVFMVSTDGTSFATLHSFTATASYGAPNSDGANPAAGLVLSGNTLYGTTWGGGTSGLGTVFSVSTAGTGFKVIHSFSDNSDGYEPLCQLLLSGNTLFGTAWASRINTGTIFSLSLPVNLPQLAITPVGGNIILTWPTNAAGFTLQSATNLGSTAVWTTVSAATVFVNGQDRVTNSLSLTQRFYRLAQ